MSLFHIVSLVQGEVNEQNSLAMIGISTTTNEYVDNKRNSPDGIQRRQQARHYRLPCVRPATEF